MGIETRIKLPGRAFCFHDYLDVGTDEPAAASLVYVTLHLLIEASIGDYPGQEPPTDKQVRGSFLNLAFRISVHVLLRIFLKHAPLVFVLVSDPSLEGVVRLGFDQ